MTLMNPSININGTAKESMIRDRRNVANRLTKAIRAMQETLPHGRDYVGRDHQFSIDRAIYRARIKSLEALRSNMIDEALAIMESK